MSTYTINNANIITPGEVLIGGSVTVENGKIAEVAPASKKDDSKNFPVIDAKGNYLMPGIIDIHTDAMDVEICPRAGADFPIEVAFRELEKRMCGTGISTAYHSLHLGYKVAENNLRSKYSRRQIFEEVFNASQKHTLIHNKIHLRYEISGTEDFELCYELVDKGYISLFSFMDHTPGQGQMSVDRYLQFAQKKGKTEDQAKEELEKIMNRPRISKKQIEDLIKFIQVRNIAIASHDDDTVNKVNENHALGIGICEFPINIETATKATELNMSVVGGASNVLRSGSTGGNLDMQLGIKNGVINVLCSDYYSPSLLHSVFLLHKNNILSLPEAVKLVTLNAAKSVHIDGSKGSIEAGKDADMVLVNYSGNFPTVVNTIVDGNVSGQYNLKPSKVYEFTN